MKQICFNCDKRCEEKNITIYQNKFYCLECLNEEKSLEVDRTVVIPKDTNSLTTEQKALLIWRCYNNKELDEILSNTSDFSLEYIAADYFSTFDGLMPIVMFINSQNNLTVSILKHSIKLHNHDSCETYKSEQIKPNESSLIEGLQNIILTYFKELK